MTETNEADFIEIKGKETNVVKWYLANKAKVAKVTEQEGDFNILTV